MFYVMENFDPDAGGVLSRLGNVGGGEFKFENDKKHLLFKPYSPTLLYLIAVVLWLFISNFLNRHYALIR